MRPSHSASDQFRYPVARPPKHHDGPALGAVMPETAQGGADRWCVYATVSGLTERGSEAWITRPVHRMLLRSRQRRYALKINRIINL
ncbi:hypothetical protein SPHINGOT1_20161 [Sphingomonas sp. T1]|nr:hypothetical protein SPHINGOT1_20161 [Sphingomonas sp. T1]